MIYFYILGVLWWVVILIVVIVMVIGYVIDVGLGYKVLIFVFIGCYIVGCVGVVLVVW